MCTTLLSDCTTAFASSSRCARVCTERASAPASSSAVSRRAFPSGREMSIGSATRSPGSEGGDSSSAEELPAPCSPEGGGEKSGGSDDCCCRKEGGEETEEPAEDDEARCRGASPETTGVSVRQKEGEETMPETSTSDVAYAAWMKRGNAPQGTGRSAPTTTPVNTALRTDIVYARSVAAQHREYMAQPRCASAGTSSRNLPHHAGAGTSSLPLSPESSMGASLSCTSPKEAMRKYVSSEWRHRRSCGRRVEWNVSHWKHGTICGKHSPVQAWFWSVTSGTTVTATADKSATCAPEART